MEFDNVLFISIINEQKYVDNINLIGYNYINQSNKRLQMIKFD
jgi:hypothetical protein